MSEENILKNFLELSYDELEQLNLKARSIKDPKEAQKTHIQNLKKRTEIKAVSVCFCDIEGRLHMLDYEYKALRL